MKALLTCSLLSLIAVSSAMAQRPVDAKEIFAKIDRKETVAYDNVAITGDLDLTSLSNRRSVSNDRWGGNTESYLSEVGVPLTFRNCTFKGKFLAYRSEPKGSSLLSGVNNKLFNTNFDEAVTFENCTFEDEATFKYSEIRQKAVFRGNTFRNLALFKYTRFRAAADFNTSEFLGYADFKYTHFEEGAGFEKARFSRSADFKYTHFNEGVNFRNARFETTADFKYTHLPRGSNFDNAVFDGPADFKYATLDGRKFSPGR